MLRKNIKSLKVGVQLDVRTNSENGKHFLKYREMSSKNHQGGLKDLKHQPKVCHAYENTSNPQQCIVHLYEKYLTMRPDQDVRCSNGFYLRPLATVNKLSIGFSVQPQGIHAIEKTVACLCKEGGIPGYKTNHSLRAMTATCMFAQGLDEHLICERTGHNSNAVRNYKHTSSVQQVQISNLLHGVPSKKASVRTATVSKNPEHDSDDDFVFTPGPMRIESKDPEIRHIMDKKVCDCTNEEFATVRPFLEKLDKRRASMNVNLHIHLD